MIDLGFIQLPLETINVIVIVTALLLSAAYIGFDIIATIGGIIAIIYGLRVVMYEYEIVISRHILGTYEAYLLIVVGVFLLYRGFVSLTDRGDINTWN